MFKNKKFIVNMVFLFLFVIAIIIASNVLKRDLFSISLPHQLNYYWVVSILLFQLVFWFISTLAWHSCIATFTKIKISFISSFIHCNTVAIGKYLPGKIWGIVGRGVGLRESGLNKKEIFSVSYIDQIILLHSGFVLGALTFFISHDSHYLAILFPLILLTVPSAPVLHNMLFNIRYISAVTQKISPVHITITSYSYLFVIYFLLWLVAGLVFASIYFFLYGFEVHLLFLLIGACTIGIISGFLAFFSPGGIGVREATSVAFLSLSIPVEKAILLVLVYRVWTSLTDIVGGGISLYLVNFNKIKG